MNTAVAIRRKLEFVFDKEQAEILSEIITDAYSDLVRTSDFNELKDIVKDLAIAQTRTETRIEELAEAQKRTEEELHTLVLDHKETRRQLGGLSATVGYSLEDKAYLALPALLKRDFDITLKERLKRGYVTDNRGKDSEINIIGQGNRSGSNVIIIGESKSQLSKNNVDEFIRRKLNRLNGVFDEEIFPLLITYMISSPGVEEYAKEKGITLYYSYDLLPANSVF